MKTVFKAGLIVFAACVVLFLILRIAGLGNVDAAKLALSPFSAITLVHSKVESHAKSRSDQSRLPTLDEFSMSFFKMLVLGTASAVALFELISALGGIIAGLGSAFVKEGNQSLLRVSEIGLVPVSIYAVYAVGRWVGIRAAAKPFLVAAVVGAFCRLFDTGLGLIILSRESFQAIFNAQKTDAGAIAGQVLFGIVLYGGTCVLGSWRGQRRRQAWYLDHLLKSIAPESRGAILELAYEEARRTIARPPEVARAAGMQ